MSEKFRRHLAALLWKNALLKRRHPCSLCCELGLAVGATGLLVVARMLTSNIKAMEIPAQVHVDQTRPVHLPDCAEYLADCSVRLVEPHNPMCVKDVSFGCKAPDGVHGNAPGVWVSMGCWGTFDVGPGFPHVHCGSRRLGKANVCHVSGKHPVSNTRCGHFGIMQRECEARGCCYDPDADSACHHCQSFSVSDRRLKQAPDASALLLTGLQAAALGSSPGMRRLSAQFGIAPRSAGVEAFSRWLSATGHPWADNIRLFDSAEDVQAHVAAESYPQRDLHTNTSSLLCGAVLFETPPESAAVRYTLRFNVSVGYDPNVPPLVRMMTSTKIKTDNLVDTPSTKAPGRFDGGGGIAWYTQSGFLALQRTVDTFLEEHAQPEPNRGTAANASSLGHGFGAGSSWLGEDGRPHVVVPFPTASWKRDPFAMLMPNLLASFLLISLAYSVNRMITAVVHEREVRLRDGMRMMGMHTAAFYSSWIVTYMTIYVFVTASVVLCLTAGKILPHSSSSLLFVWLLLFAAASISYALVITTFFSKAKTAATVGSVAFYTSSYLVHLAQASSSPGYLRLLALSPPVCFELAAKVFADMESQGVGVEWHNMDVVASRHFSIRDGCCMLAVDSVLFLLVFLYLDQVVPREVGLQRPWFFPLQPSFWRELCSGSGRTAASAAAARSAASSSSSSSGTAAASQVQDPREPERTALVERDIGEAAAMMSRSGQTVELRGLSKSFGAILAVRKLDLVMYQGEIFALLGHNGAGKTTTLAMLCGLMHPSEGSCAVFGHDLSRESAQVQKMLGVCPQHDVLWDELSCEEHLTLFAGFKGVPRADTAQEVATTLQRVGLWSAGAGTKHAGSLSGGMKRKLSLGIAFLGGSRLVVLDEPTSGLDPYSRRMVWELLRAMKQGRVTVLSTHYMDEADILGDRIAILHEGRLRCCGSPQFLKRAYDCGYNVTFVKLAGCETDAVREAVCRHMPELASEVATLSDSGNELILQFPFAAARLFPQVLGGIEKHMSSLRVESYGVSVTTLEEVFLKVASGESVERPSVVDSGGESDRAGEYVELQEVPAALQAREVHLRVPVGGGGGTGGSSGGSPQKAPGSKHALAGALTDSNARASSGLRATRLAARQLLALLQKRWRYGLRDRRGLLCQLFLPSCTLLLLLLLMSAKLFYSMPALELQAHNYNQHCTGGPQNLVDFTYLPSVDPADAEAMLAPGRPFWRGDLRRSDPEPEGEEDWAEERALVSTAPGILQNILRPAVQQLITSKTAQEPGVLDSALRELLDRVIRPAVQRGRRLGGVDAENNALQRLLEARLEALVTHLWAAEIQARDGVGAALEAAMSPLPGIGLSTIQGMRGTAKHSSAASRRLREGCAGAWPLEDKLWESADPHNSGRVGKARARAMIRHWIRSANGRSDREAPDSREEAIDRLTEEALFQVLDQDGDDFIDSGEFCAFGATVQDKVGRWYGFAEHFSEQLMNTSSECTRYGAYYVVSPARTSVSPKWAAGSDAVVFVNTSSSHAAPVFHAALTNARFSRLGLRKSVAVKVHPFPQTRDEQHSLEKIAVFLLAIYITFCLSFIPSGIAHFVVKERQTGARQLQVLSGATHLSYWLANLIFDVALYVVPALCVPLALHQFGFKMILAGECGKALAAVLAAFGPAVASFSYLVAFLFKDHSKASNAILTFCLVGASVLSTVLFILSSINYNPLAEHPTACETPTATHTEGTCLSPLARTAARILGPIFRLVPTVCVYQALFFIALIANIHATIPEEAVEAFMAMAGEGTSGVSASPFAYDWAGQPLQYLCAEAVGYFALAVVLDVCTHNPRLLKLLDPACWASRTQRNNNSSSGDAAGAAPGAALLRGWHGGVVPVGPPLMEDGPADASPHPGDDTVEVECERAAHVSAHDVALHIWRLEKTYQSWLSLLLPGRASGRGGSKRAVQGVSLAVHAGEVFGLLGHNGAGKTSALKCIVGELCCTAGRVHVGGHDMGKQAGEAQKSLGYCPQFDALLELLTVQDHLDLFAALKGLPQESAVQAKHDFNLGAIVHRRAELLSGGNKRKLSAALALIGGPRLAVLDEPSCGLDPAARRALWATVHSVVAVASTRASASAVLLTTHSMEEAEALSSRLGIMAEGKLLTVGTAQQIKQRRGGAHELCLTLRPEPEGLLAEVLRHLGSGTLVPETPLGLGSLAPLLERDGAKRQAYERPRCVVRAQIEATGRVEASVLAEWWLQQSRGEAIERFLRELVGEGVELAENFGAYWRFCLPHGRVGLPELFRQLEEGGNELGIAEYTLTQATLEQIFNGIAQDAEGQAT